MLPNHHLGRVPISKPYLDMKPSIRILLLALLTWMGGASAASAFEFPEVWAFSPAASTPNVAEVPSNGEIFITTKNNQVRVQNAEGLTLDIYNVAGVKVATYRVDSDDKTVTLNLNRGIYIAKVGKVARRINLL